MASSSHNVELEAAKFLHKLIQDSKEEPSKLATKLFAILQHMKSSGKEHSMPFQVISRAMETVINQHGLDLEALKSSRLPTAGSQAVDSTLGQYVGSSQAVAVPKDYKAGLAQNEIPREGRDVLRTRELNQQGGAILINSNPPLPMYTSSPIGAMETSKSHQLGVRSNVFVKFEPFMSNSIKEVKDEGNSQIPSVKRRRLRSTVWKHFYKKENGRAICNYCRKDFDGSSQKGTTRLRNHFNRCKKAPINVRDEQMIFPGERTICVGEGNSSFDQERSNLDVARMIIKHQLPLDMVQYEFFGILLKNLQPTFKLQPLEGLTSDILRVYNEEKLKLHEHFDKLSCRFNLTINSWVQNVE